PRPAVKPSQTAAGRAKSPAAAAAGTSLMEKAANRPAEKKALPPAVMWLMTLGTMLLVSAIALLVFYYLIVSFTKIGNFLDLPLPGLPPKVKRSALLDRPP